MENWINNKKYTQNGKRILKLLSNFSNYTIIYFRLLFFLAIIFYSSNCSETGDTNYIQSIEYFEDKVGSKDFEEVISSPLQKYSSKHFIRFGFSPSTYWIRVVLKKDVKDSPLFLEIGNPRLSEVDFYYYNDRTEKWETKGYGRFTNLDEREFKTHHYISAFSPSSKFQEIWIRVFSRTEVYLPIDISSVNQIVNYNRGQDIVKSWVIGFNFLVCILGLIGFIIFKRDYLLYFFAYLFFLNLSLVENESIAGDYFSLSRLIRYDQIDQVTRYLTYIFAGLFSFNYILTKELKEKY
ncbi:MAG: hypothetical protein KDK36_05140, partial [Leptospiraceae bacterium]|nr:hypothetical protein [Leptospiraceae bacterium]